MTILGQTPSQNSGEQITFAKNRIANMLNRMYTQTEQQLSQIKNIVDRHGRAAVDEAFGDDAAEFSALYAAGKAFAEQNSNCSVEDLPS